MLSTRWHKVARDLWLYKTRTALVVLSIAVGVFAVGVIMTSSTVISREMNAAYMNSSPPSVQVFSGGLNADDVQALGRWEEVARVEGSISYYLRARVGDRRWQSLRLASFDDFDDIQVGKVWPGTGDWPPPRYEILIERQSMATLGVEVGDMVEIEGGGGKSRRLRVAGTVHDVGQVPSPLSGVILGYVTPRTLEWLGLSTEYSVLNIVVSGDVQDKEHVEAQAERITTRIEKSGHKVWGHWAPPPGRHPSDEVVQPILVILGFLGVMALGLSGFLVVNTITAILAQQIRQVGIMKAVGARRTQIVRLYLGMVLILGGLSLLVAVPSGALVAALFSDYLANVINFDIHSYAIPIKVFVVEVGVGLVAPILAALVPVLTGTRVSVREATSDYGLSRARRGARRRDSLLGRLRGIPRPLVLSLRNTFRRKARLALTLLTLTLGGCIFIGILCVQSSLASTLDDALNYFNHEVTIQFQRAYRIEQVEREARRVPGVIAAESWGVAGAYRVLPDGDQSDQLFLIAPPANTEMIVPILVEGRWLLEDDENAIVINTSVLDNEPDLKVGDELLLRIDDGLGRDEISWRIVGVVKAVMTGPIAYANYPYFGRALGRVGRASQVRLQLTAKDAASQLAAANALETHLQRAGLRVRSWDLIADDRARVENQLGIIVSLLVAMSVLLGVVGGLGLMGTMSINVVERTCEIGVMRAIGASSRDVRRIVIVEGILISLISWALGALLAVPMSKGLGAAVGETVIHTSLNYTFSFIGVALWLLIVIVLAVTASYLPARRASRLTVRDVLAYE